MNAYKKTSIKFCNQQYSREIRHTETLKARESSRFKRLSMIRDINDSDLLIEMEPVKSDETKKLMKPTVSRLDMLFKWKQEKQLKKQLESKYKKQPFYVGGNSNQPTSKSNKTLKNISSVMDQTNFNASKIVKSKLLAPKSSFLPSKLPNFSKQTNSTQKPLSFPSKGNNTAGFPKTITKSFGNSVTTVNQTNSTQKPISFMNKRNNNAGLPKTITKSYGNSVSTVNQQCSVPKAMIKNEKIAVVKHTPIGMKFSKTSGTCPKTVNQLSDPSAKQKFKSTPILQKKIPLTSTNQKSVQPPILQKTSSIQRTINKSGKVPSVNNPINEKTTNITSVKTINQESSLRKITTRFPIKSAQKGSSLPIITSSKFSNKSTQKIPLPSTNQISVQHPILQKEVSFCPRNIATRKGYCFKEATAGAQKKITECKNSFKEEIEKDIKKENGEILPSEESLLHIPYIDLNCDISVIKPISNSFAPVDFEFKPPAGLSDFVFGDDEDDPYEALEHVKLKFMSRTSTPSKAEKSTRDSDVQEIKNNVKEKDSIEEDIDKENVVNGEKSIKEESNKETCESDIFKMVELDNNKTELVNTHEELSACSESPLDIIDVNKFKEEFDEELELMNMEGNKINIIDDAIEKPESVKLERKSASVVPKRVSMLKNMSTLNSIAETDDCPAECLVAIQKNNMNTPRRSKRHSVSSRQQLDFLTEPIQEENLQCLPNTPRRSLRLQKAKTVNLELVDPSPFEQNKSTPKIGPRRSMRLINLNTPENGANDQDCVKSNLTVDFEKLNLLDSENTDPNAFLIDFDNNPSIATGFKPRKVSLLYTPEKKSKIIRKSIRGDLMSFSPSK